MLSELILLAVDKAAYNESLHSFQGSVTIAGIGVIGLGASMLFSKHKVVGLIVCAIGAGIAAYPWLAFAPIK